MDYGSAAGTAVLPATGLGLSLATGMWFPVALLGLIVIGVLLIRVGFRRGRSVDEF